MLTRKILEQHFLEAWKKENSAEEDSAKTIGTPITILGLSVTMFSLLKETIRTTPADIYVIILIGFFVAFLAFASMTIANVIEAIKPRLFAFPPPEKDMLEYAKAREKELLDEGMSPNDVIVHLETEIGDIYVASLAEMVTNNRAINVDRLFRRSQALLYSIYSLVASGAIIAYLTIRALPL